MSPERRATGEWVGQPGPAIGPRLFGGQAIGQALMAAAGEECEDRLAHSLHAHFLRAGAASVPIEYVVTTLAEGRSFATRRVDARQDETMIFSMTTSFHAAEPGFAHAVAPPFDLDIDTARASLDSWVEHNVEAGRSPILDRLRHRPIEIVPLDPGSLFGTRPREPQIGSWMRMRDRTGAGPVLQRALLAYASDMMFLRNAMLPHGIRPGSSSVQAASLDHAIWFHENPDFDQWHLFATGSPWAGHARGLNQGHFFDQQGKLIATVTQESLMRPRGDALDRVVAQVPPA
ncbi:thioesterase family protein [Qipengyuania sp. RS5-5]|uniref:Thioesterase family protein n=1 Tax=Parerythrobacter lacustris TaxID=2969984 RepID=A0ABT1XPC9_9SPHN|nr:acyl-CoA thioesterase domain-containing protein [Parerythrobacter lacustris]MCR2833509.1 thioesterase family protein [Parerythrobacter lacustris]